MSFREIDPICKFQVRNHNPNGILYGSHCSRLASPERTAKNIRRFARARFELADIQKPPFVRGGAQPEVGRAKWQPGSGSVGAARHDNGRRDDGLVSAAHKIREPARLVRPRQDSGDLLMTNVGRASTRRNLIYNIRGAGNCAYLPFSKKTYASTKKVFSKSREVSVQFSKKI